MHYTKKNTKEPNNFCQGAKFGSGATDLDNPAVRIYFFWYVISKTVTSIQIKKNCFRTDYTIDMYVRVL